MNLLDHKHDKTFLHLLALGICVAVTGCNVKLSSPEPERKPVADVGAGATGRRSATFLAGGEGSFSLDSYKGRPLLVSIQGVGTPYLASELAAVNRLNADWGPRGLSVVALLAGQTPEDDLSALVSSLAPSCPIALATPELLKDLGGVRAFPTLLLVDASGAVRKQYSGALNPAELATDLAALMASP